MAQKSVKGSSSLASQIRDRRIELGLTIEAAAHRAGVGTKTWYRYESGESIRSDKCKGICKALNWPKFPDADTDNVVCLNEYTNHEAWSSYLEEQFGSIAAMSFAVGSDILLDNIKVDLGSLTSTAKGSHIGQLGISLLECALPEQFLTYYDYEFLYQMKCSLLDLRRRAKEGLPIVAHSILQELLIYMCAEEAAAFIELCDENNQFDEYDENWVFDMFDDMDIITYLYSDRYLDEHHPFHFSKWGILQFYMD